MLLSSPYAAINDAFHHARMGESPFHPGRRARITLMECLEARGYDCVYELHWPTKVAIQWDLEQKKIVSDVKWNECDKRNEYVNEKRISETSFITSLLLDTSFDDLLFVACRTKHEKETLCVFWPLKPYTKSQMDEICLSFLLPHKITTIIVVSEQPVKTQCCLLFQHRGIDCTFFSYNDLKFNITHHILVPKYRVMTTLPPTIKPIDKYRLPTLLKTDPVCIFYGWKVGTVVQIESLTGKTEPEYRIVRADHMWRPISPSSSLFSQPPKKPPHDTMMTIIEQPNKQHNICEFLKMC